MCQWLLTSCLVVRVVFFWFLLLQHIDVACVGSFGIVDSVLLLNRYWCTGLIGRESARAFEANASVECYTKRVQLLGVHHREVFAILVC